MSYTSENIKRHHEAAIAKIKACNGLIGDEHRPNGKIQITHVGVFQQGPQAKNPVLVALLDGVLFCINHIDITDDEITLSRNSVGGTVEFVSLSMDERCQRYNDDEGRLGKFLEIIPVKDSAAKAA
jgi:hypothetical protein